MVNQQRERMSDTQVYSDLTVWRVRQMNKTEVLQSTCYPIYSDTLLCTDQAVYSRVGKEVRNMGSMRHDIIVMSWI